MGQGAVGRLAVLLLAAALSGCGFAVAAGAHLKGGVRRVEVGLLENRSADPGAGAAVTEALRRELQRRGASADAAGTRSAPAGLLEGEVRTSAAGARLPGGATQRLALEVRARLSSGGQTLVEPVIRREAEALIGADALEGEAWRAHAISRLADEVARALVDALEEQ
jgi:hypothetical protein